MTGESPGVPLALPGVRAEAVRALARDGRMVFVAGVPGVGKSLLLRELAEAAHAAGRRVSLLQWDVLRLPFDAPVFQQRYPEVGGITHAVLRKAAGLWARDAVATWAAGNQDAEAALLGEAPLVGNRLVELARSMDDAAEDTLAADALFVVPAPSGDVRAAIETARAATAAAVRHPRERGDAVPSVLRALWRGLREDAAVMAAEEGAPPPDSDDYDRDVYLRVFARALRRRRWAALYVDASLPADARSVYDIAAPVDDLAPSPQEAAAYVERVERAYPDLAALEREAAAWWRT